MSPQEFTDAVRAEVEKAMAKSVSHADDKSMRADLLDLSKQITDMKKMLVSGQGLQKNDGDFTKEDLKKLLPKRIDAMSLQEVADYVEQGSA
jgi:hypothetical protein